MLVPKDDTRSVPEQRGVRERAAQLEAAERTPEHDKRGAEELFRLMADAAPVMVWMSGPDTLCTFFNKPWLQFRGRTIEQELGIGWSQGVHPDDLQRCMDIYLNSFHARKEFQMEYRLQRHDGEYRWILDKGVPRFEAEGLFAGYIGSGLDINDRKAPVSREPLPITEREKQVLMLIAEGHSTKEVAALLGISYKTADSHRSKIMEKLGVHETATLVR